MLQLPKQLAKPSHPVKFHPPCRLRLFVPVGMAFTNLSAENHAMTVIKIILMDVPQAALQILRQLALP